jgi:4-amino-4-deoxy-L-arabinose transferase-like glycosyltransferase
MNHPDDDAIEALLRKQFEGHVPDDGFSERVMQRLPSHRSRTTWPLWAGLLVGAGVCAWSLLSSPLLQAGWRDWMASELSVPAIVLLIPVAGLSLLALLWALMETEDNGDTRGGVH